MVGREFNRFRKGQGCSEPGCKAKYWYSENDGLRYCKNGHRIEGYVQYDFDEEDNFGKAGKTSRRKQEAREKISRHVTGPEARGLFTACVQLILRQQIAWLEARFGSSAPAPSAAATIKLERIVRQLWDWRLRKVQDLHGFGSRGSGDRDGSKGKGRGREKEVDRAGDTEEDSDGIALDTRFTKRKSWWMKEAWPLPTLPETLALLYLGCLFVKLPVRLGDLYHWAKMGSLPFVRSYERIPEHGRERLPGWAQQALKPKPWSLDGDGLHKTVRELVSCYKDNFQLGVPAIDRQLFLPLVLRDLALPSVADHVELLFTVFRMELEMDEYLEWYQTTKLGGVKNETEFDRLFPLETTDINAVPPLRDLSEFEIETRNQRVREAMFKVDPVPDVEDAKPLARMGDQYQLYGRLNRYVLGNRTRMSGLGYDAVVDVDEEGDLGHTDLQEDLEFHASDFNNAAPGARKGTGASSGLPPPVTVPSGSSDKRFLWSLSFYAQFFDVDTSAMLSRCWAALYPRANFLDVLEGNPDLYGPFWIATTVVLILFLGGTISDYLASTGQQPFAYDFKLLSGAAGLIYGYTLFVPMALWLALRYFGSESANLLECWALYGYGNLIWIPVALISWSPIAILNWVFVGIGFGLSVAFLLRNLYPVLSATDRQVSKILLIVVLTLHFGLAIAVKVVFFAHGKHDCSERDTFVE
ncbi:hypothetical protein P8C59_001289 [Phyllachora maydis]|uniref:Yip1 domain-containing protein n=1 Tax=Phyllachora maydis TaxID=1825666 RepID=A0AAD9HZ08_9PEZI|nr:hypothetical protein P8C59_001289 [Phyllachora maydis]